MNDFRKWIRLAEAVNREAPASPDQAMAALKKGDMGCWIMDDGTIDHCSQYQHSDAAELTFYDDYDELSSEDLRKTYANVIPPEWRSLIPSDLALLHGWIRAGFRRGLLYAEIIKGRPSPQARKTFLTLVQTVEPLVKEYSLDYNVDDPNYVGQSAYVGPDIRRFIAALNAR